MPLIQRWVGAVALGAFCALLAWQVTLAMVPRAPLLIDAVPVAAPYWSLSVFDAQTDAVFVANNQAGMAPLRLAVTGPGQRAPAGYRAVPVSAARGIALVRILIDRTRPIGAIDAARRATRCRPAG